MSKIEWLEQAVDMKVNQELTWNEITSKLRNYFPEEADEIGVYNTIRGNVRKTEQYKQLQRERKQCDTEQTTQPCKKTIKETGEVLFEEIIELLDGDELTPEHVMVAHNLKPSEWKVVLFTSNVWQSQVKGGKKIALWQSKLTVKPIVNEITFSDFDRYFQSKAFSNDKPLTTALQYDPNGETLEIDLPDLHAGLLAWRMETGGDYDLTIARYRFFSCINDAIERCKGRKFKKILFVTLGDLLHFDNDKQETTKGTFQQADGRTAKIFDCVLDMLIDGITMLANIAPVEVIYLSGNHDRVMGYALMRAVEKAFVKDDNVQFDTAPDPQKYRLVGVTLIGFTHGDMPTKNMPSWLQHRARKEYGESKFAEIHAGHFHSIKTIEAKRDFNQTDDVGGIVIRYLPTICNASYWEHQQGYVSGMQSVMSFVWSESVGLREMWYSSL